MVKVSFLGAMGCVGASGILLETGSEKILIDYGTKPSETPPKFPLPAGRVDCILLSHAHLDHSGAVPLLMKDNSPPVYALEVTKELTELLLLDSIKISHEEGISLPFTKQHVEQTIQNFVPLDYRKKFRIGSTEFVFLDAGHIPGSAMIYLKTGRQKILYTGDFNNINTRLLKAYDHELPEVDTLIIECTYSDRDHPERKSEEKELVRIVEETIAKDGVALISAFAVGRAQEVLLILHKHGIDYPVYLDGMAKNATTIINKHRNFLKEPNSLDLALENVTYVKPRMRKKLIKEPCVIVTTSGMLSGGPIVQYIKALYANESCSLLLTGWQLEGTPGRILLETGRFIGDGLDLEVRMLVKRLDLSAHAGRSGLIEFIKKVAPEKVFCIHGDHTEEFACELREKGFDAVAPLANNRSFVLD
jgi:putative mRNA 3-end processing factor